ncbi:MAG: hypothetical protein P1P84_08480 [Deferrisomatales bacterium]|nr:hypothetical protein [Deferrisomatales bacterium]
MLGVVTETTGGVHSIPRRLAGGLRQVAQRAAGLPESERRRALELYLSCQLQGEGRPEVPALLRETLAQFETRRGVAPPWAHADGSVAHAVPGGAGSAAGQSQLDLEALIGKIRSLVGVEADPDLTPEALLEQVRTREEAVERAVQQTAQEFFDRLMQALDPAAARAFVGKPGLRPAPLYKAAVFDAYAEKFSQLAEYHGKGRLVRDFRASFKRNLRG